MLFPYVESKRVVLRPAGSDAAPAVYDLLFQGGRSALPTRDEFVRDFSHGVAAHFLAQDRGTGEAVGFCALTELSVAGHVRMSAHVNADRSDGVEEDAALLTVNFAFAMWRVRKVYIRTHEADLAGMGLTGEHSWMARPEAVLPDHLYFAGKLWDEHVHAVHRDDWDVAGVPLLAARV